MRRPWLSLSAAILCILIAAASVVYYRFRARIVGPPVPECGGAPLPRRSFSPAIRLFAPGGGSDSDLEPTAALMPDGSVAVAFMSMHGFLPDNVLVAGKIPLDGAPQLTTVRSDRKKAYDPWLTTSADGMVHLFWLGHDSGIPEKRMQVAWSSSRDALRWSVPIDAHAPSDCPEGVRGCLDKPMATWAGDAAALFYYSVPGGGLRTARLEQGVRASASALVGDGAYGDVTTDARGNIHLVYVNTGTESKSRYGNTATWIEYRTSRDGGRTFSSPARVSAADVPMPLLFASPRVAVDADRGFIYVAYPTGTDDLRWDLTLAASADGGRSWRYAQVNDDPHCANHMLPMLAVDPKTGKAHIAWFENRTGAGGVAHTTCAPGGAPCLPNEAVSASPFASYRLGRHGRDWVGDYAAMVLDPERRLLHVIWGQPVDEGGRPASRIFYAVSRLEPGQAQRHRDESKTPTRTAASILNQR